jgi:hypothetical protein
MPRPRLQFRLSTLLWLTLAVGCWFGGMKWQRHLDTPVDWWSRKFGTTLNEEVEAQTMVMSNGDVYERTIPQWERTGNLAEVAPEVEASD